MTREHWVGFLIGALDEHQRDEVEQHIAQDSGAAEELDQLRSRLNLLSDGLDEAAPPSGLASRTCALLDNPHLFAKTLDETLDSAPAAQEDAPQPKRREAFESIGGGRASFTLMDMLVAIGACVAAVAIFFPALASSRLLATRLQCENNLHQVGLALQDFASNSPDRRYPKIATQGPTSVTGSYAPKLIGDGHITYPELLRCTEQQDGDLNVQPMPTLAQLENAPADELNELQRRLANVYNYNMGSVLDGKLRAAAMRGRANFPVASDVVLLDDQEIVPQAHKDGRINILYDDGHVEFAAPKDLPETMRQYFLNDNGKVAPGVNEDDAVVANGMAHPRTQPELKPAP